MYPEIFFEILVVVLMIQKLPETFSHFCIYILLYYYNHLELCILPMNYYSKGISPKSKIKKMSHLLGGNSEKKPGVGVSDKHRN